MNIFNTHERRMLDFNDWMNLKKQSYGGPSSLIQLKDNKSKLLKDYKRLVKRHEIYKHSVYDSTYKAMGGDLVHKQKFGKNPYTYPNPYNNSAFPIIDISKKKMNENYCSDFKTFIKKNKKIK